MEIVHYGLFIWLIILLLFSPFQSNSAFVCKLTSVSSQQEFIDQMTDFRNADDKEEMIIVRVIILYGMLHTNILRTIYGHL